MTNFEACKVIWKNLVPKQGQADNLQGELLRQIEQLRWEAQNNGNINWDNNFEYFCDFLKETLCEKQFLTDEEEKAVINALDRIEAAGIVAEKFNQGLLSEEELEYEFEQNDGLAYVDDDLYNIVAEAIGKFYLQNPEPIPYCSNPEIYR